MADEGGGPLTASLVRTLTDKLYEKRKAAALEIEKQVRECVGSGDWASVGKMVEVLGGLARSQNPHNRKGGLIGLAAAGIALGRHGANYVDALVLPVLQAFHDPDSRVRYFACESLYNICKVAREAVLPHFPQLFDTLARLAADSDQNVRNGGDVLDRLLKDVVSGRKEMEVGEVVLLIRERIHSKDSKVRRFLIAWLATVEALPGARVADLVPEVLDGLFSILSDETEKLAEATEAVLGQLLSGVRKEAGELPLQDMLNVLIVHAQSPQPLVQYTALFWLAELMELRGAPLLPFASGLLTAVLPCLALAEERPKVHDVAKAINVQLMRLVKETEKGAEEDGGPLDLSSVVSVLSTHLSHPAVYTRVAVLKWIHHLHQKCPVRMFPLMEELFTRLLRMLSDSSDEVVLLDLEVLASLCTGEPSDSAPQLLADLRPSLSPAAKSQLSHLSPYFVKFALNLLRLFRDEPSLLVQRGAFILRQLSLLLSPSEILATLSVLLEEEEDLEFATMMVNSLSGILLTATEFHALRSSLKTLDSAELLRQFRVMYKAWAHQPVALIALCLLARRYAHAAQLILAFPDLEITTDFLVEIDKFIQLLESPIFAYLRLDLLQPAHQSHLSAVLYGLLMILPQTEAFLSLQRRLHALPPNSAASPASSPPPKNDPATKDLLPHFSALQARHLNYRRTRHQQLLSRTAS